MPTNNEAIATELATTSIGKLLMRYSVPAVISMAATSLYNIIGSIFVGQGLGPIALSAMGITFPVMNLFFAFSLLVGIGGASYASIYLGRRDMDNACSVLGNVALLNIINSIIVAVLMWVFLDAMLLFFGASANTLPYAVAFMKPMLFGAPITYSMFNLNHVMRATGYPAKAMCSILLSVVVSAVLVPIAIFWLGWGMAGAAIGTVCAQAVALVWVLAHYFRQDSMLHFKRGIFRLRGRIVRAIFSVGLAPCLVNIFGCLVAVFLNLALWRYEGDMGIGALGIVNRVLLLFAMIVVGLSQGMQPIIGFNYGAGNMDRVRKTLRRGLVVASLITVFGFVLGQLTPEFITGLFTDNVTLTTLAKQGLHLGMIAFPLVGAQIVIQQFFQCIGQPKISIFLSTTRQLLFLVPLLLVLPNLFQVRGVWISLSISDFLAFVMAAFMLYFYHSREAKRGRIANPLP